MAWCYVCDTDFKFAYGIFCSVFNFFNEFVVLEQCWVDVGLFVRKYLVIGLIVAFLFGDLIG